MRLRDLRLIVEQLRAGGGGGGDSGVEVTVGNGIALSTHVAEEHSFEMGGTWAYVPFSEGGEVALEVPVGGGWVFVGGAAEVHGVDGAGGFNVVVGIDGTPAGPQVSGGSGADWIVAQSALVPISLTEGPHTVDIVVSDDASAVEVFARKRRLTVLPLF